MEELWREGAADYPAGDDPATIRESLDRLAAEIGYYLPPEVSAVDAVSCDAARLAADLHLRGADAIYVAAAYRLRIHS